MEDEARRQAKADALTARIRQQKEKERAEREEQERYAAEAAALLDPTALNDMPTYRGDYGFSMNTQEPTANTHTYDPDQRRSEYQMGGSSSSSSSAGGAASGDNASSTFPAAGIHWTVVGDPTYGEAQPALDVATTTQYAAQWDVFRDNNPQLMVFYEGLENWTPWSQARVALNM